MKKSIKPRRSSAKRNAINYAREYYIPDHVRDWSDEDAVVERIDEYPTLALHHMRKLSLDKGNKSSFAGIIMLPHKWIVLDVYNYYGILEVDRWDAWTNGRKLKFSPLFFASIKKDIIDRILEEIDLDVELEFMMVFMSCDSEGRFRSTEDIGVLTEDQLEQYLGKLEREARDHQFTDEEFEDMKRRLDPYIFDIDDYFESKGVSEYELRMNTLGKGLKCAACSNIVEVGEDNCCRCDACGNSFPRLDTVLENIIEYCRIHKTNFFTTNDISDFIDNAVDKEAIRSIISSFFMTKQEYLKEIGADEEITIE